MARYLLFLYLMLMLLGASTGAKSQVLTAVDSASIWPRRVYVRLDECQFPIHYAQAHQINNAPGKVPPVSIEIYNLLVPAGKVQQLFTSVAAHHKRVFGTEDSLLVTLSILPNSKGMIDWQPVDLDAIPAKHLVSTADIIRDGGERIEAYRSAGNPRDHLLTTRTNLFPIIRRQGRYWAPSSYVLTEYFLIQPRTTHSLAQADYVTINVKSPIISFGAPWRDIRALLPAKRNYEYSMAMGIALEGKHQGLFEFWSRPEINISHPGLRHFGIGVFMYKPGIGIVSGQYAQYFYKLNPLNWQITFDRIMVDNNTKIK